MREPTGSRNPSGEAGDTKGQAVVEAGAPQALMPAGTNGLRIKKGTVWGNPDGTKSPPKVAPHLHVSGQGLEKGGPNSSPRPPSSAGPGRNGLSTPASADRRTAATSARGPTCMVPRLPCTYTSPAWAC